MNLNSLDIKKLAIVFFACVAGIVICFGMTLYTSFQESAQQKAAALNQVVPMPAIRQ